MARRAPALETDPITGQGANDVAPIESKEFFRTSEFWVMLLTTLAIAITAMADEAFDAPRAMSLITFLVIGYIISRGIAKAGTDHLYRGRELPFRNRGGGADATMDMSALEARLARLEGRRTTR